MKHLPALLLASLVLIPVLSITGQQPEPTEVIRGQPIQLFDGKSLTGWSRLDGEPSQNWVVQDGSLHCQKRGGDLYHEHWFKDFELSFTWKILKDGNSGVKYRVKNYGNRLLGCEYQIYDDQQKPFGKQSTGALYALFEPAKSKTVHPLGQWNESKIVVCGNRVEHWLNGQLVVQATVGSPDWLDRVSNSKFREYACFGQNQEGRIFLQDHGKPVWFSKIELVPLVCQ